MRMSRFSLGVPRMERINTTSIRGTYHGRCSGDKGRDADRDGRVEMRNSDVVGTRRLKLEGQGRKPRRTSKRWFMYVEKEVIGMDGRSKVNIKERVKWR